MIENREFIPGHLIKLVSGDAELLEGTLPETELRKTRSWTCASRLLEVCVPSGARSACVVFVVSAERCVNVPVKQLGIALCGFFVAFCDTCGGCVFWFGVT